MTIESIVRPFQTPSSAPAKPFNVAGKAAPPVVICQFGRGGGGKTFNGNQSYAATFYMTQYMNEKETASWGSTS